MMYPEFDPIIIQLGPAALRWYGLMYLIGFVAAWWLARRRASAGGVIKPEQVDDLIFYGALGVILGGRLGYIFFYNFDQWLADPFVLLRVWEGGMAFHGGLLGVIVAMALIAKRLQLRFFQVADFVAPLVPLGLLAGRVGNFINGELWGGITDAAWGMQVKCAEHLNLCVNKLGLPADTELSPPLHPSQLYEAVLEGLLLFLLLWWFSSKPRAVGAVSGLFLIGYGSMRFIVEFVRMPDAHIGYLWGDWFTMGQLLSTPMILAGIAFVIWANRTQKTR
jgi:phosphatidylglycerol:prolipoprotein diacylglycerol transferase